MDATSVLDYAQKLAELLKSPYGWIAITPFAITYILSLNKYFGLPLRPKSLREKLEHYNLLLQDSDLSAQLKDVIRDKKEELVFKSLFGIRAKTKLRSAMIEFVEQTPPDCDFSNLHSARHSLALDSAQENLTVKISKGAYAYAIFSLVVGYLIFFAGCASMLVLIPSDSAKMALSIVAIRILSGIGIFIASALTSIFFFNPMRDLVQARFIAKNLDALPKQAKEQKLSERVELPPSEPNLIEQ